MRTASLVLYLLASGATAIWAQQPSVPDLAQLPASTITRDPHSTKDDLAVPLCPAKFDDSLETNGIAASEDKSVTSPVLKHAVEAEFSDEAWRLKKEKKQELTFEVDISLVVDASGKPQNVCLTRSVGYGLDARAAKAVQQFQFSPATKDDKPVAVRISIQIKSKLF